MFVCFPKPNWPGVGCTTSDLGCTSCTPGVQEIGAIDCTPNYRDFRDNLLVEVHEPCNAYVSTLNWLSDF